MTGAIDTFTTETYARDGFIQQAKNGLIIGSVLKVI
jgi:hypothetical protein